MRPWFRFLDWSLRVKMASLLVLASALPLAVAALVDIRDARQSLLASTSALLEARGDQLVRELDSFHRGYQRAADCVAHLPDIVLFRQATGDPADRLRPPVRALLDVWPASDPNIRGVAVLDRSGVVQVATEQALVGKDLSFQAHIREALEGHEVISDIHIAQEGIPSVPTIAYLAPVRGPDQTLLGVVALWVRATGLWNVMKASNALAGPGSFAVLFDHEGIRIAHTYSDDIVFHPGGPLTAATVDVLAAERRFGEKTREFLEQVRAFPEQFERARAASPDPGVFRGFAPVNQRWNYGVARRFESVPWTVFYMVPEQALNAQMATMTWDKTLFAGVIVLLALLVGTLFAAVILGAIRVLSRATEALAGGDLDARVAVPRGDEIGLLGASFNVMADRIRTQTQALFSANEGLELRVQERTAELVQTTKNLEVEIVERTRAEEALRLSEQSLAATLDSIGDAVIATDAAGLVVRMNPVAEKLTGWRFPEARGKGLREVFHILNEDTREPVESPVERVLREGFVVGLANHTALVARNGVERAIADSGAPIRDSRGSLIGVVLVFRDQSEERQAERVLRESEARKGAILEAALDCIVTMDHTGAITEFNPAAERTFGYSRSGAIGKPLATLLIPPGLRERHVDGFRRYLATGVGPILGKRIEMPALRASGIEFPVELAVVATRLDGPPMFTAYLRDITQRKQAEEALRASEERFQALEQNSWDAVHLLSADGVILYESPSVIRVLGYSPEELVGRNSFELVHSDDVARVGERFAPLATTPGLTLTAEVRVRHKDGSWPWMDCVATNLLEHPAVKAIAVNYRDITERRRTEQALRESEEHFRFLNDLGEATRTLADPEQIMAVMARMLGEHLHASRCAYADVENDGERFTILHDYTDGCTSTVGNYQLSLFGARAVATLHHGQTLIIGNVKAELLPGEGADMFNAIGIQAIITCPLVKDGGLRAMMAVHQTTPREWKLDEISIVQEVVERCWATIERRSAEEKIRQLNLELEQRVVERTAQLEAANKELEAFSYSVSHDLRAPLRTLDGFSQAVLEDYGQQLPEEGQRYLQTIRAGAQRMGELVDDLLAFARLSRQSLKKRTVDTGSLVRAVLADLEAAQQGREIEIRTGDLPPCEGDPALLKQVWFNLLANALKYTGNCQPAIVETGCQRGNGANIYFVRDNGAGFDMAYAHKLFGVFQRLHRAEDYEGTGIGLAIVQRVIQRHGGRVWAEAAAGKGATFYFTLEGETES